jgi:hypothetical protein
MNVVVDLGFAVVKYTIHGGKVSTLGFTGAVFTGVVTVYVTHTMTLDLH